MRSDLGVRLGPVELKNPVLCGSGEHVMSYDGLVAAIDAGAAAVVAKSANESEAARRQLASAEYVLLSERWEPLEWGAAPRSASLLNRSGLVAAPFDEWLETLAAADSYAAERDAYVVASVIPGDAHELPRLAAAVQAAGLRWLELNLSAPHAGESPPGAVDRAAEAERVRELTALARAAATIPLTVKLTSESADVIALAAGAREAGADAVCLCGRRLGFLPDPETRRPVLGTFGAVGGPWELPLTLRWVAKARAALGQALPIVGTGGARDGLDIARFLLAGASAVQLATAVHVEGAVALSRALAELEAYLERQGMGARDLIGEAADAALTYEEAAVRTHA